MSLTILIPCKSLDRGKSRLSPLLDATARRRLCELFLRRTLTVAASLVCAQQVRVITSDNGAKAIADSFCVPTIGDDDAGLNEALGKACRRLAAVTDAARDLLVLPIDLPRVTVDGLNAVLSASEDVVLAPDEDRVGTNVLLLRPSAASGFRFLFGPTSFADHCLQARRKGLSLRVVEDRSLAFDIDRPEQYLRWTAQPAGNPGGSVPPTWLHEAGPPPG